LRSSPRCVGRWYTASPRRPGAGIPSSSQIQLTCLDFPRPPRTLRPLVQPSLGWMRLEETGGGDNSPDDYCEPASETQTNMTYYVETRWGGSEDTPTEARMREILCELDAPDPEHPDTWLSHDSGWTLSVFESGLVIWENPEQGHRPKYLQSVSRDEALRMWMLLSGGAFAEIESAPWKDGYGPPLSEEEKQKRQREVAEMTMKAHRDFYDTLGPEDASRPCRHEGCTRGSVKFSVLCRPHHFESLYKQPCPFDD
jgi:hypothetical protein